MKFNLVRPCAECPFRNDRPGYLRRAKEISDGLLTDGTFTCHKTNTYDDDGDAMETSDSEHCAGALILLEKLGRPDQMMRWMERLGAYDYKRLDMDSPVFNTPAEFIKHHGTKWRVSGKR